MQVSPFQNRTLGVFGGGQYAPPQMQPSIYPTQEHPCNGMGGANCECGGSCATNKPIAGRYTDSYISEIEQLQNSGIHQEEIDSQIDSILHTEEVIVSSAMRAAPVSSSILSEMIISTSFMSSGKVVSEIRQASDLKRLLGVIYDRSSDNSGWIAKYSKDKQVISNHATANDFNVALWSAYIAKEIILSKITEGSNKTDPKISIPQQKQDGPCDDAIEAYHDISIHDLKCSVVGDVWQLDVPCATTYVNLNSCCLTHDIDLWCGPSLEEQVIPGGILEWLTRVNLKFAGCVMGKVFEATINADVPWYCGGKITAFASAILFSIAVGASVFTATQFLTIALWVAQDEKLGLLGQHKDSCLCGGKKPTSDGCRDLCVERGFAQDCYQCHWECVYENGEYIGKKWVTDLSGKQKCCNSSTRECRKDCDGHSKYCPTCSGCYNICEPDKKGNWKWTVEKTHPNIACCPGQPKPPRGRCDNKHHGGFLN